MIICSCNVLSDHDVRLLLAAAATPLRAAQVWQGLGCSAQCGRCTRSIRQIIGMVSAGSATTTCGDPDDRTGA